MKRSAKVSAERVHDEARRSLNQVDRHSVQAQFGRSEHLGEHKNIGSGKNQV